MDTLAELEQKLTAQGLKITKNRRLILQGLLEMKPWSTAQELFTYVAAHNQKVNFSTIYRNLDLLTELGILCRINVTNDPHCYALNLEESRHHHLVCKSCRKVCPIDFCPLSRLAPVDLQNFSNLECDFTIYGICEDCQSPKPSDAGCRN